MISLIPSPPVPFTVELLSGGASAKPLSDNDSMATSLKRLEELLDKVYAYVDAVTVSGAGVGQV